MQNFDAKEAERLLREVFRTEEIANSLMKKRL